ncbi:hypothetical protein GF342_01645 [Candidatus Woesearchaeota archaeon]|nr:hypothetical protein [Candidatus Woesearchaeota archaeon]
MVRRAALKTTISTVLSAPLEQEENVVFLRIGTEEVSRVNIIATVISVLKESNMATIDDGTGQLMLQWFDAHHDVEVGSIVVVIGRVRQYGSRYVFPEIIKKIEDPLWVKVRAKELEELPVSSVVEEHHSDPDESALRLIHESDKGDGADMEELIEKLGEQGEEIIKRLLMAGEIFETKPGRIRLL